MNYDRTEAVVIVGGDGAAGVAAGVGGRGNYHYKAFHRRVLCEDGSRAWAYPCI